MKADMADQGFMQGMKSLLGMDDDLIEQLLEALDNDSLLALTDAVAKNDRNAALAIVQSFDNDLHLNSLFRGADVDDRPEKEKKKPTKPPKDYEFNIGDDVALKTTNEDTGEDEFVSATVFQPNAPGETIGVKIEGKPRMVDKDEVYTLNEMVMGMVGVPNLQRMQQLAGIAEAPPEIEVQSATPSVTDQAPADAFAQALCALDTLDAVMPNVRMADLKIIRQRLSGMQTKMNESAVRTGRAKRV